MDKEQLLKLGLTDEQSDAVLRMEKNELDKIKIDFAAETALIAAGAKNVKAAKALIDFEKIKISGNSAEGLDEQIHDLINDEDTSFLFGGKEDKTKKFKGFKPEEGKDQTKPKDFKKMTYTEMCKYLKEK